MRNANISIRYKLLVSFIAIAFLTVPMSIYTLTSTNRVTHDFMNIVDYSFPRLQALLEMQMAAMQVTSFVNNFNTEIQEMSINENTPNKIGASKDIMLAYLNEIEEWQIFYQNHLSKSDENILNLKELIILRDNVVLAALNSFNTLEKKSTLNNEVIARNALVAAQKKLERFIKASISNELDALLKKKNNSISEAKKIFFITLLINSLIFIMGILISLILTALISKPIIRLKDFAGRINQDNLDQQFYSTSKDEIGELAISINQMLENLSKAKTQLIEASRAAGIAEIATSILHNIGNVLNSINTASSIMMETINQSSADNLEQLSGLLIQNKENLPEFLQTSQGKCIIPYLEKISKQLMLNNVTLRDELKRLIENLQHVNNIIDMQQGLGRSKGVIETINMQELIKSALTLSTNQIKQLKINTILDFQDVPPIKSVKAKIQQILINLIKNSIESLAESKHTDKQIIVKLLKFEDKLQISVSDNGIGIKKDNLDKIFLFGFTTKTHGHGYGIHHSALLATELGGKLLASSEGVGQGATFVLEIPCHTQSAENTITA